MLLLDFEVTDPSGYRFLTLGKPNSCLFKLTNQSSQTWQWEPGQRLKFHFRQGVIKDLSQIKLDCLLSGEKPEVSHAISLHEAHIELRTKRLLEIPKGKILQVTVGGIELHKHGGSRSTAIMAELLPKSGEAIYQEVQNIDLLQEASTREFSMPVFELEYIRNPPIQIGVTTDDEYAFAGRLHPDLIPHLNLRGLKFGLQGSSFSVKGKNLDGAIIWFGNAKSHKALTDNPSPVQLKQSLKLKEVDIAYPEELAAFILKVRMKPEHKLSSGNPVDDVLLNYSHIPNLPLGRLRLPFPAEDPRLIAHQDRSGQVLHHKNPLIPKGTIVMWSGSKVPKGWALCDGNPDHNGDELPDLSDRFVMSAKYHDGSIDYGHKTGGQSKIVLKVNQCPGILKTEEVEEYQKKGCVYDDEEGDFFLVNQKHHIEKVDKINLKEKEKAFHKILRSRQRSIGLPSSNLEKKKAIGNITWLGNYEPKSFDKGGGYKLVKAIKTEQVDITPPYYTLAFIIKV